MEIDFSQNGASSRERFRLIPCARQTAVGSGPYASTTGDIENVHRNPIQGWPTYGVSLPLGDPRLTPPNPFMRPSFEGAPPHHDFARGANDPLAFSHVSIALEEYGARRAHRRDFRMLDGKGEPGPP